MVVKNLTSNGFLSYHNEIFSYVTVIMFGEKTGVVIDKVSLVLGPIRLLKMVGTHL